MTTSTSITPEAARSIACDVTPNNDTPYCFLWADLRAEPIVMPDYQPPFKFTGDIKRAIVDVTGEAVQDYESQMRVYLARQ